MPTLVQLLVVTVLLQFMHPSLSAALSSVTTPALCYQLSRIHVSMEFASPQRDSAMQEQMTSMCLHPSVPKLSPVRSLPIILAVPILLEQRAQLTYIQLRKG